jgi:hypothetical protein
MLRRALAVVLFALPAQAIAQPKSWIWESEDASEREAKLFRFSPRLNFWSGNFDRPPRACKTVAIPRIAEPRALRSTQIDFPDPFCPSEDSDELAFGSGVEIAFRTIPFIYLTAGIDFVYTAPEFDAVKNQLIIALPFGIMFTYYEWAFRPIAHFEITPVLYVTDDSRDYTLGGNGGVAYRILDFGSISVTAGYLWAETMTAIQVQIGVHPIL